MSYLPEGKLSFSNGRIWIEPVAGYAPRIGAGGLAGPVTVEPLYGPAVDVTEAVAAALAPYLVKATGEAVGR